METLLENIKYDKQGLIPAIIQDKNTKEVLMMAYMNEESLKKTIETKKTWFYSRSRQKLWNKGETSGNYQLVENITVDCDLDTLLVEVTPLGNACHTGKRTCFYTPLLEGTKVEGINDILLELYQRIESRRDDPQKGSYTNYLFNEGLDKILKKIGEESSEIIIASKNEGKDELVYEISDFIYHLLVLMVEKNIVLDDIVKELDGRKK